MATRPLQALTELIHLLVEKRVREADVSDGTRVPHGSAKHVKDLEARIASLTMWRDKQRRGSEARANYARVINRLKSELASAKRVAAKRTVTEAAGDDETDEQKWEKLVRGETADDTVKEIVQAFLSAPDQQTLAQIRDEVMQRVHARELSTVVTAGFVSWLYDRRAHELGLNDQPTVRKLK